MQHNSLIMRIILIFIAFPLAVVIFFSPPETGNDKYQDDVFDTTAVHGYTFYSNHGVSFDNHSNIALYNALFPLMGIPHRSRAGRDGLDCSGLVRKVYNQVFELNLRGSSRDIVRHTLEVDSKNLKEADLIFFKINSGQINHIGIYLNNGKFAHASSRSGVVINDLSQPYYQEHFYKAGRLTD